MCLLLLCYVGNYYVCLSSISQNHMKCLWSKLISILWIFRPRTFKTHSSEQAYLISARTPLAPGFPSAGGQLTPSPSTSSPLLPGYLSPTGGQLAPAPSSPGYPSPAVGQITSSIFTSSPHLTVYPSPTGGQITPSPSTSSPPSPGLSSPAVGHNNLPPPTSLPGSTSTYPTNQPTSSPSSLLYKTQLTTAVQRPSTSINEMSNEVGHLNLSLN
jgi:hypothetical protein